MLPTESKKPIPTKPTKIITVIIHSHGADLVVPNYKIPLNVRILSAAGIPGCFNFGTNSQRVGELGHAMGILETQRAKTDFTTYKILDELRTALFSEDRERGYKNMNDVMDKTIDRMTASRFVPVQGASALLAKTRTEQAINQGKRYKVIKPTTDHRYMFTPKRDPESGVFPDGIYVIDSMNNPDSRLKLNDNLAENKFDINETRVKTGVIPSSIHDIRPIHINYVRRKFGPYLSLAKLYCDGDNILPFTSVEEVSKWVTDNYSPVDNIYRLGCMKLFQTGINPIHLKALMCATFLGEKFAAPKRPKALKPGEEPDPREGWEREIFPAILDSFNKLSAEIKPKFITGLTPAEFEKILSKYHVSYHPEYVGDTWNDNRDILVQLYNNSDIISNEMLEIPEETKFDSENIHETTLTQIIKYLRSLGYDGINIVDFSCRVNTTLTDKEMFEQEEKETLSPRVSNTNWGGVKFRKTQSKRRLKKSKVKRKKSKKSKRRKAI